MFGLAFRSGYNRTFQARGSQGSVVLGGRKTDGILGGRKTADILGGRKTADILGGRKTADRLRQTAARNPRFEREVKFAPYFILGKTAGSIGDDRIVPV